jgi:hypothetical protein
MRRRVQQQTKKSSNLLLKSLAKVVSPLQVRVKPKLAAQVRQRV